MQDPDEDEDEDDEAADMERDIRTPSFEFRFETAKLLLELDETTEDAIQVSTSLAINRKFQLPRSN